MRHTIGSVMILAVACGMALGQSKRPKWESVSERQLPGWSDWKLILTEKYDSQFDTRSFVTDPRFEFRWRREWTENGYGCSVEIRPSGDADQSDRIPEFDMVYQSPDRTYTAPDAPIARRPPQVHFFATLDVPIGNKLRHANFNLTDCERVGAVAAGHFGPGVGIPAF